MCSRGVYQLRVLKLQYCDWGGSSKGVRELLDGDLIDQFLAQNEHLKFIAYMRRGAHPYIRSEYINAWTKTVSLRNLSPSEIMDAFERERSQCGRRAWKFSGNKVISTNKSVQGKWTANMWGTDLRYEDEVLRELPEVPLQIIMRKKTVKQVTSEAQKLEEFMKQRII